MPVLIAFIIDITQFTLVLDLASDLDQSTSFERLDPTFTSAIAASLKAVLSPVLAVRHP